MAAITEGDQIRKMVVPAAMAGQHVVHMQMGCAVRKLANTLIAISLEDSLADEWPVGWQRRALGPAARAR
jgi:hypothetical protein